MRPTIIEESLIDFNLVQSGTVAKKTFYVVNPSEQRILVQILPFTAREFYSNTNENGKDANTNNVHFDRNGKSIINNNQKFLLNNKFENSQQNNHQQQQQQQQQQQTIKKVSTIEVFSFYEESQSVAFIDPGRKVPLGEIIFKPKSGDTVSAIIFLRNNLTILDYFKVIGKGGSGNIWLENEELSKKINKTELTTTLKTAFTEEQLYFCQDGGNNWKNSENFVPIMNDNGNGNDDNDNANDGLIKQMNGDLIEGFFIMKNFVMVNVGDLPIHIKDVKIPNRGKNLFSIKITNVKYEQMKFGKLFQKFNKKYSKVVQKTLIIQPGEKANLTIFFTPDFSSSEIKRQLKITTKYGILKFPLLFIISRDLLKKCQGKQPLTANEYLIFEILKAIIIGLCIYYIFEMLKDYLFLKKLKNYGMQLKLKEIQKNKEK